MAKDMLVAVGEALIDLIPKNIDDEVLYAPKVGGAPANVCGAYAKLGGRARMLTQLGDDIFGHRIMKELSACGIDMSCVSLTDKANTALAFVELGDDGSRDFSFYRKPSADMLYSRENIREEYFSEAYALHFCSVSLGDFPMRDAHIEAITAARKKGALISFDPNLRFPLWDSREELRKTVLRFLPMADIVKVSDEEIGFITGEEDIEKALPELFKGEVRMVIYTCGSKGAYAFTKNERAFAQGEKVTAADTTGAGDGFIGAFLREMNRLGVNAGNIGDISKEELSRCLELANRFCAISVQRRGAIASYPTAEELKI